MLGNGEPGRDVEVYTYAVASEYHLERRLLDIDIEGHLVPVVFVFILSALNVVVARKNNELAAYNWIEQHRVH